MPNPEHDIPICIIRDIINHAPALQISPVDIIVAPAQGPAQGALYRRIQSVQGVAGRRGTPMP